MTNQAKMTKINNKLKNLPTNLNDSQRDFITIFFQTNSLNMTRNLLNLSVEDCVLLYKDPLVRDTLRKLEIERQKKLFKNKMLSLEQLGIFLSNHLIDYDMPLSERFDNKEKIDATKLLLDIHKTMNSYVENPNILMSQTNIKNELNIEKLEVSELKEILSKLEK